MRSVVLVESSTARIRSTATGETGQMLGVNAKNNSTFVANKNVAVQTASENAGAIDLKQSGNAIVGVDPSASRFVMSEGTIRLRLPNISPGTSEGLPLTPSP